MPAFRGKTEGHSLQNHFVRLQSSLRQSNNSSHPMQTASIHFDKFNQLHDEACHERIRAARVQLGKRVVILGHHYQRTEVYQYADLTGDSLKLSRLASQTDAEYIVFCGVHFMSEVADFGLVNG